MNLIDKITKKQMIYLVIVSIPTFIIHLFPKWFVVNYIIGGIMTNITIWSWLIIMVWNNAKEKQQLREENKELKQKLKGAEKL